MLEDLGNLGDFLGGIAVIATLIYLAIQLRQNTRILQSVGEQTTRTDSTATIALIAQSPEQRKRAVLETVLGMLRTEGGAPIEPPAEEEAGWDEVVGEQSWGLLPAVPENAWPRIERLRLPEWCEEATGWCVDRPPRRSSLAAAVLREGLSGVITSRQVGRKKGTKLAEGLAALKRSAVRARNHRSSMAEAPLPSPANTRKPARTTAIA